MRRPRFSFCPNPLDSEHMAAWKTLQTVPEGQRSGFIARAILKMQEDTVLEETLRRVLREELQELPSQTGTIPEKTEERSAPETGSGQEIPQEMLGFLADLMGEN